MARVGIMICFGFSFYLQFTLLDSFVFTVLPVLPVLPVLSVLSALPVLPVLPVLSLSQLHEVSGLPVCPCVWPEQLLTTCCCGASCFS